jgi:hypothetical protein
MDWFLCNQSFQDWLPWLAVCWLRSGNKIRDSVCISVSVFLKTVFNISPWVSSSHWGSGSNVTQCSNESSWLNLTHFLWPDMDEIESISGLHRPPSNSFSNLVQESYRQNSGNLNYYFSSAVCAVSVRSSVCGSVCPKKTF